MNLIEAYRQNNTGKFRRRATSFVIDFSHFESLLIAINKGLIYGAGDLLANDYEIVKEKKKVVIEGATWEEISYVNEGDICREFIHPNANYRWSDFLHKPPMKMTLEWEE